jgi:hypothetical protein
MDKEHFRQRVFLELLRSYHDGIGSLFAEPPEEVTVQLAREANAIVRAYYRESE